MKKRAAALLSAFFLLLSACSTGKGTAGTARRASFFAMDTFMELSVCGDEALLDEAEAVIRGIERAVSVTDEKSERTQFSGTLGRI